MTQKVANGGVPRVMAVCILIGRASVNAGGVTVTMQRPTNTGPVTDHARMNIVIALPLFSLLRYVATSVSCIYIRAH